MTLIRPSRDLHALGRCPRVVAIRIGASERTGQPGFTGFETIRWRGYGREAIRDLYDPQLETILVMMTTASISDLKANLSRYLRVVRRGGEVQVLDRGTPVARLVPPAANDDEGVRERLIAKGILRPGKGNAAAILDKPPLALPVNLSEALAEDRTDRL